MAGLILVKANQKENAFGRYCGELLRAEGLNWFSIEKLWGRRYALLYLAPVKPRQQIRLEFEV